MPRCTAPGYRQRPSSAAHLLRSHPLRCASRPCRAFAASANAGKGVKTINLQDANGKAKRFRVAPRAFVLPVLGACAVAAALHVDAEAMAFVGQLAQIHPLAAPLQVLLGVSQRLPLLCVADHPAAIAFWALVRAMEVGAIMTILAKRGGNSDAEGKALAQLQTLLQALLPSTLPLLKQLVKTLRCPKAALPGSTAHTPASLLLVQPPPPPPPPDCYAILDAGDAAAAPPAASHGGPHQGAASNIVPWARPVAAPAANPAAIAPPDAPDELSPAPDADVELLSTYVKVPKVVPPDPYIFAEGATDVYQVQEQRMRRIFPKNCSYAVALSKKIDTKPVGIEALGERVVLFRDDKGTLFAINDVCPHRGALLHKGWVGKVDGRSCVMCRYHGAAFDADGYLRDVPSNEKADKGKCPKLPVTASYEVEEWGGWVWLYHGDQQLPTDQRAPIPLIPELNDPKWRTVYSEIMIECGHWSVFENAMDFAHIFFVHAFGSKEEPSVRDLNVQTGPYGVTASFVLTNKPVNPLWAWSKVQEVKVEVQVFLPSTSVIRFKLGFGLEFVTTVNTVPIDEERTVNQFALSRTLQTPIAPNLFNSLFNWDLLDGFVRSAMMGVQNEDKETLENSRPGLVRRELAFRTLRRKWLEKGPWRADA